MTNLVPWFIILKTDDDEIPYLQLLGFVVVYCHATRTNVDCMGMCLDKVLYTFPIDIIYKNNAPLTKGRRVTSPVSFFKQGILSGEPLVCTVNSQPLNSSIKIWKPSSGGTANPIRYRLGRFFHNSNRDILNITESLRVHKVNLEFINLNEVSCWHGGCSIIFK